MNNQFTVEGIVQEGDSPAFAPEFLNTLPIEPNIFVATFAFLQSQREPFIIYEPYPTLKLIKSKVFENGTSLTDTSAYVQLRRLITGPVMTNFLLNQNIRFYDYSPKSFEVTIRATHVTVPSDYWDFAVISSNHQRDR